MSGVQAKLEGFTHNDIFPQERINTIKAFHPLPLKAAWLSRAKPQIGNMQNQRGQMSIFFALLLVALVTFMLIGVEVGRIVYARGEVGKSADAAALAAASRINISLYRETGQVVFLPDAYDYSQTYAAMNSSYLSSRSIPVTVTSVSIDEGSQTISVAVTANLSSLLPAVLNYKRQFTVIGYAQGRLDGR